MQQQRDFNGWLQCRIASAEEMGPYVVVPEKSLEESVARPVYALYGA